MSSMIGTYYLGYSGMSVNQTALATISHNLSNVNTTGYSRQRVNTSELVSADSVVGSGTTTESVTRLRSSMLDQTYRSENADLSYYEAKNETLTAAEELLGDFSTTVVKQDLRYTCAYVFADFDGDRYFETSLPRVDKVPPTDSKGGNMETLSVKSILQSGSPHLTKTGRIRLIYHNAWSNRTDASSAVHEGLVYDIPVRTVSVKTSVSENLYNEKISRSGNRLTLSNARSIHLNIFDLTGKQMHRELVTENFKELYLTEQPLIIQFIRPDGSSFTQLI